ncbi:MAG TPA: hypothetical protein VK797_22875 [Tepidisphaeraceae bacterium]|jgi:hypothetical protein|nr:hypothetical protein [Tepidisphaeraceae bacterium]
MSEPLAKLHYTLKPKPALWPGLLLCAVYLVVWPQGWWPWRDFLYLGIILFQIQLVRRATWLNRRGIWLNEQAERTMRLGAWGDQTLKDRIAKHRAAGAPDQAFYENGNGMYVPSASELARDELACDLATSILADGANYDSIWGTAAGGERFVVCVHAAEAVEGDNFNEMFNSDPKMMETARRRILRSPYGVFLERNRLS